MIVSFLVRSSIMVMLCGFVAFLLRKRGAEIRHFLWMGGLFGFFVLPVLQLWMPPLGPTPKFVGDKKMAMIRIGIAPEIRTHSVIPAKRAAEIPLLPILYLSVTGVLLIRLAVGLARAKRLVERSTPSRQLGEDVRISSEICVPVAVGLRKATIILPNSWPDWPEDKLNAVLRHEQAHLRRGDPATAMLSSLAVCFFWIHPMVYLVKRQLEVLAEEACDHAALEFIAPKRYAEILIELAKDVAQHGSRVFAASSAISRTSRIAQRLKKIFAPSRKQPSPNWIKSLLLLVFFPILFCGASARFNQQTDLSGTNDPEYEEHSRLLERSVNDSDTPAATRQLLWLIENKPGSPDAGLAWWLYTPPGRLRPRESEEIAAAWERALALNGNSAPVLSNASNFIRSRDPLCALDLLRKAQRIAPPDSPDQQSYTRQIAAIYCAALDPSAHLDSIQMPEVTAAVLNSELQSSTDPALLSDVGTLLSQFSNAPILPENARKFLQKAIALDPGNPKWEEALESAAAEPMRRETLKQMQQAKSETIHVPYVSAIYKVIPKCPATAIQAGISGTVNFTVGISPEGSVTTIRLESGHPLLVPSALNAVRLYSFKPTIMNGNPVAVSTSVAIPFNCAQ